MDVTVETTRDGYGECVVMWHQISEGKGRHFPGDQGRGGGYPGKKSGQAARKGGYPPFRGPREEKRAGTRGAMTIHDDNLSGYPGKKPRLAQNRGGYPLHVAQDPVSSSGYPLVVLI